jgi:hypothetical protein
MEVEKPAPVIHKGVASDAQKDKNLPHVRLDAALPRRYAGPTILVTWLFKRSSI